MRVAIASGKGGTGKTTVAVNLAVTAARSGRDTAYLDCDVEEPNGALFLRPRIDAAEAVTVGVPRVDMERCQGCGVCGRICQYSAVVVVNREVLVFPKLCHSCGGCMLVCPHGAITEVPRETGRLERGWAGPLRVAQGVLNVGEAMSPPIIRRVKESAPDRGLVILDAPPGASCPAVETVRGADFVVLVTEPTPFGLNDLALAVEMARALGLPVGVVINRSGHNDGAAHAFCANHGLEVLAEFPDDRRVAEAYSRGELVCEALPEYEGRFADLLARIEERAAVARAAS